MFIPKHSVSISELPNSCAHGKTPVYLFSKWQIAQISLVSIMKLGTLIAILTFCAGAAFTLVDIGSDAALAYEYWNNSDSVRGWLYSNQTSNSLSSAYNFVFAFYTTVWLALGGLVQFILVARSLYRRDVRLDCLPKTVKILLLLSSPFLMAPVIVNAHGVISVIRNSEDDRTQDSVLRYA